MPTASAWPAMVGFGEVIIVGTKNIGLGTESWAALSNCKAWTLTPLLPNFIEETRG